MAELILNILGGEGHKLRGKELENGEQVFLVYDVLTLGCEKQDKGVYARKIFSEKFKNEASEYYQEFQGLFPNHQFSGTLNIIAYIL